MTGPNRPETTHDDELLARLDELLSARTEPPPGVVDAAVELFTWRTVDAELAALTADSLLDEQPAGVRAAAQPRILTFEAGALTIEVEVDAGPGGRRLLGQLVPAQTAELELRGDGAPVTGTADEMGRFVLPLGPTRQRIALRCRLADDTLVESATAVV